MSEENRKKEETMEEPTREMEKETGAETDLPETEPAAEQEEAKKAAEAKEAEAAEETAEDGKERKFFKKKKDKKDEKEKRTEGTKSNAVFGGNYVNCYCGFLHCTGWFL